MALRSWGALIPTRISMSQLKHSDTFGVKIADILALFQDKSMGEILSMNALANLELPIASSRLILLIHGGLK